MEGEAEEEIRTLFIIGLPVDVKVREIYNLFQCRGEAWGLEPALAPCLCSLLF